MPTTRRSTRSSTGAGKQSTLSFKHKVTKAIKTGKEGYKSPSRAKEYIPEPTPEPTSKKLEKEEDEDEDEDEQTPATTDDDDEHDVQVQTKKQQQQQRQQPAAAAEKISDRAIERYWSEIEAGRNAKAVHKKHGEGLTTGEKVLRYFDVSSQYGPCIGMKRIKRWQRAQRLGLNPPVEVLAVLLKEEAAGNKGIETAHMDELLNSAAVGSVGV
ncbi:DNA polymerase delta, subunit 4-domain-containing protein [Chaetomidium leptoderma]|uniref:DNA polymerase delta, subunit 4-domain-containing protein n=1 Tax=Chaetomidium leptoderma TaxID=669021 RepID=A0AAN6VF38_9PEZI|nr:DNA polymerase delta, subunit 4-domain-containing protein [Chaetomidium leptoderma]